MINYYFLLGNLDGQRQQQFAVTENDNFMI